LARSWAVCLPRLRFGLVFSSAVLLTACEVGSLRADDRSPAGAETIAATVGGEAIYSSEVTRLLRTAVRDQKVRPTAQAVLQAQALAELIDRRLVLAYARRAGEYPSAAEIDAAMAAHKTRLAAEGRTLAGSPGETSLSEADLRRQVAWGLVWDKYLAKYLTAQRLAACFAAHRREFDGTEIAVSHILLRPSPGADRAKWDELVKQAAAIRRSILAGEISFADAARKHSAGPSGKEGGQLGFISRRGVMDESFSRAAFALEPGQVSQPIITPFGVHLIGCESIRPGAKQLADVRKDVEDALARELLDKIARLEDRHTPVKFPGRAPHFKPGTRDLVTP
jgi:parvulin-like peptidyl-prolyl isomerase